jgi:alkylhydroperoxidase family enzyme
MSDIQQARAALVKGILEGDGTASRDQRRAAFELAELSEPLGALLQKVARRAHTVTDEDVAAVRSAGLSEDQIFELVVCAAVGEATRQNETALAALQAARAKA